VPRRRDMDPILWRRKPLVDSRGPIAEMLGNQAFRSHLSQA
jgi:hypothetical protein